MLAIDVNTVIVPSLGHHPGVGSVAVTAGGDSDQLSQDIREGRGRGELGTCHSQNIKIEIVNRSVIAMSVYDEGDIVIISWARINQSLGDEPCNLSSIALQILNVLKYLH